MPRPTELAESERYVLESLTDKYDLSAVLRALALVCIEKTEHVQCNWQDETTAKRWDRAHKALMRTSEHASIAAVSE